MKDGKRKLAAIMFTDVVRYSAMSHTDERLALELLAEHQGIVRPILARFHGQEIKTIGDAFLVLFDSALDAMECAIAVQQRHEERNRAVEPGRQLHLRIGVHVGDVIVTEGDVYGDGVNIASRLQGKALPGCIRFSGSVYYQIENKINAPIQRLGMRTFKNIAKPIATFELQVDHTWTGQEAGEAPPLRMPRVTHRWIRGAVATLAFLGAVVVVRAILPPPLPVSPAESRVAVLPFQGIGLSADEAYLSEGMTEGVIGRLARVPTLRVLARNSVAQVDPARKSLIQVGRELGVGVLVQGVVRKQGNRVKVSVNFVDAATAENRWSQDFEAPAREIYGLEKDIAEKVTGQLTGRTLASLPQPGGTGRQGSAGRGPASITPMPTPDSEAYHLFLRGRYFLNKRSEEGLMRGMDELKRSAELDPTHGPTFAALANAASLKAFYGLISPTEAWTQGFTYIDKALQLDPGSTDALLSLAEGNAFYRLDVKAADDVFRRAIAGAPAHATAHQWYAEFLAVTEHAAEADREIREALRLDPISIVVKSAAANVYYFTRRYEDSIRFAQAAMDLDPHSIIPHYWLGRSYLATQRVAEGIRELEKANELSGRAPMVLGMLGYAYGLAGKREAAARIQAELKRQSQNRYVSAYIRALAKVGIGSRQEAIAELRQADAERSSNFLMIPVDPALDPLRDHPDFRKLAERVKTF